MTKFEKWRETITPETFVRYGWDVQFSCPICPANPCERVNMSTCSEEMRCVDAYRKWARSPYNAQNTLNNEEDTQ